MGNPVIMKYQFLFTSKNSANFVKRPQAGSLGLYVQSLPPQSVRVSAHAGGLCLCSRTLLGCRILAKVLTSLFLFSLIALPAQACPTGGNPQNIAYMRRDNNRCEGIKSRDAAGGINLISIVTRGITSYPNFLSLQIPRLSNTNPEIKVQSLSKNYLLDQFSLRPRRNRFTFKFKSHVLKKANVPPKSLRALAEVNAVYLPVTIGRTSGKYEFVFYSSRRSKFSTFEILRNGKVVHSSPRKYARRGETIFTWNGKQAPRGRYQIHVIAEQEIIGRPAEKFRRRYYFQHNPNWLK